MPHAALALAVVSLLIAGGGVALVLVLIRVTNQRITELAETVADLARYPAVAAPSAEEITRAAENGTPVPAPVARAAGIAPPIPAWVMGGPVDTSLPTSATGTRVLEPGDRGEDEVEEPEPVISEAAAARARADQLP